MKFKIYGWLALVALALGCAGGVSSEPTKSEPSTMVTAQQPAPTPLTVIDPGIWTVGPDVAPGHYKVVEIASANCYWARLAKNGDIIDNYFGAGLPEVTIKRGEQFETHDCPQWRKIT